MTADGTANEAVDGRANGHTNGRTNGHTNGHSNTHNNGNTNGHTKGHTNGAPNGSSNEAVRKQGHRTSIQPCVEVAVSPNDADAVSSTIESIQSLGKSFSPADNFGRQKMLGEARRLVRALETPRETMIKHNWAQVSVTLHLRWAAAD